MLGAHFDSWHAGTGATDNAAGSAAMMEAMRILKTTGVRMRRTVRMALWTGEEQGLSDRGRTSKSSSAIAPRCSSGRRTRSCRQLLQPRQRHRGDSRRVPARE